MAGLSSQLRKPLPHSTHHLLLCQLAPSSGVIRRARGRLGGGREKGQLFTFISAPPKALAVPFDFQLFFPTLPGAEVPEAPGRAPLLRSQSCSSAGGRLGCEDLHLFLLLLPHSHQGLFPVMISSVPSGVPPTPFSLTCLTSSSC